MSEDFQNGRAAYHEGKPISDNPYICGTTKLGNPKFSDFDAGSDWDNGYRSEIKRFATKEEIAHAAAMDVSRFRRKSNLYYRSY